MLPATASAAAAGSLNGGFGPGGSSSISGVTRLSATAVQANGDVVAAGESASGTDTQLLLARFT